ncbi:MAG: NAD(P)-dependent oxidoreductase [Actinomycetota bacterium]
MSEARKRILITGASGLIGGVLARGLKDAYDVRGVDRRRRRDVIPVRRANMRKLRSIEPTFRGADVVVDLAASPNPNIPWRTVIRNNIPATLNAFEAARKAGVKRFIFASSNHVTGLYENDKPYSSIVAGDYSGLEPSGFRRISVDDEVRPDTPYGIGKVFGEATGRYYAEHHDLSVICLRIGTVNRADAPKDPRHRATLLTQADLVRLVRCCIEAPADLHYAVFYGVSNNTWRIWDIDDARKQIGYEPADDAGAR